MTGLVREHAGWEPRLEVVEIDVADPKSVAAAGQHLSKSLGREKLDGFVNNAGLGGHINDLATVLATNNHGVQRVCESFVPLVEPVGARVVNVTSAAGPSFVAECSLE